MSMTGLTSTVYHVLLISFLILCATLVTSFYLILIIRWTLRFYIRCMNILGLEKDTMLSKKSIEFLDLLVP